MSDPQDSDTNADKVRRGTAKGPWIAAVILAVVFLLAGAYGFFSAGVDETPGTETQQQETLPAD